MADSFRAADVVLHAIDVQGVRVQNNLDEGSIINSNAGLFLVSRPTGGEVFQNSNDLHADFDRMLRQQEVVYVLGFHTPDYAPGTFHDLNVKLVNAPTGARRTRRRLLRKRPRDPVERALTNAADHRQRHPAERCSRGRPRRRVPAERRQARQVPVILDINGSDLMRETGTVIGGADVFVYAFDAARRGARPALRPPHVEMAKVGDKVRPTGIRYYGTLMLPPGSYAVKALVRTGDPDAAPRAIEKRGYARINIIVPDGRADRVLPPIPIDEDGNGCSCAAIAATAATIPSNTAAERFRRPPPPT